MFLRGLLTLTAMMCVVLSSSRAMAQDEVGDIFVSAEAEGASILIDGKDTGLRAPSMVKNQELGSHSVTVQTPCGPATEIVEVSPGRIVRAELRTPQGAGTLRVRPDPAGATVWVDGDIIEGSEGLVVLDCGVHQVKVQSDGYQTQTREIRVAEGGHQELAMTLQAVVPGTLVVEVYPLNAHLFLDGTEVAQGPVTLEPVSAGRHVLVATADGYAKYTEEIDVRENGVTRIKMNLSLADTVATPLEVTDPGSGTSLEVSPGSQTASGVSAVDSGSANKSGGASFDLAKGVGSGLSLLGLGGASYSIYQYTVAAEANRRYLDEEDDDKAESLFENEVLPAQRSFIAWGVVGGVSLLSGGIVWVRSADNLELSLDLGPHSVALRGTW